MNSTFETHPQFISPGLTIAIVGGICLFFWALKMTFYVWTIYDSRRRMWRIKHRKK